MLKVLPIMPNSCGKVLNISKSQDIRRVEVLGSSFSGYNFTTL